MPAPLSLTLASPGLRRYENQDILLHGGYSRSGPAPGGTLGAGFAVFDKALMTGDQPDASAKLGDVELFLLLPQMSLFHGLIRIEVLPHLRRRGIGRRLVEAIAATTPDGALKIYDIKEAALKFWVALGCSFQPRPPAWDAIFRLTPGPTTTTPA